MDKTYLACLTPPGHGAIATLALAGPNAWSIVRELAAKLPSVPEQGRIWFGRIGDQAHGQDEVVVVADRSRVELHCHGGPAVIEMLQNLLVSCGVEMCTWQDFVTKTETDRLVGEAMTLLPMAPTQRTAAILLDQCQGAMAGALAAIDKERAAGRRPEALRIVEQILGFTEFGRHLTQPWRVVIAGAPNVGKSSLVNALSGFQRSVVSPAPGTTRDVVTTLLAIDGWPVEISDTAGWRESGDSLEQAGMAVATQAARDADLRLWVLDASQPSVFPPDREPAYHYVINKMDLPAAWDLSRVANALKVSAKTGEGLDELISSISRWLVPIVPMPGAAVPCGDEAVRLLQKIRHDLRD